MLQFTPILMLGLFKLCTVLSGTLIVYLGYRLFQSGLFQVAGDLEASSGRSALNLKRAAPGTFFALFGALVVGLTVYRGFDFEYVTEIPLKELNAVGLPAEATFGTTQVPVPPFAPTPPTTATQTSNQESKLSTSGSSTDNPSESEAATPVYVPPQRNTVRIRAGGSTR